MDDLTLSLDRKFQRARLAHNAGNLTEAEALCRHIVAAKADAAEALHLLGVVQARRGKRDAALASYNRALAARPDNAVVLTHRGILLAEMKRFVEALASYDHALALRPDEVAALSHRGIAFNELGRFEEALASYDRALALRPADAATLSNRGNTLHGLKRFAEALASYDRALTLRPEDADALSNRAVTLHELKRFEEAVASCDRALALCPYHPEAHYNRGNALHQLNRFDEALASFDQALALRPDDAEILSNRGVSLHALKRFDEALKSYARAIAVQPHYAEAHHNESLCRLLTGDFDRGWQKYEWRWESNQLKREKRNFAQPQWDGRGAIAGKTILLHAEQGLGDTIHFCRYVPLVASHGAGVILEVPASCQELLRTLSGATQVVSRGDPLPDFDLHCPLLSLPRTFQTRLETIPATTPYLTARPQAVAAWSARLRSTHRPRIGLVWSGRPTHKNDRNRSISLRALLPLLDIEATFAIAQKDVRGDDAAVLAARRDILNFGDALQDFADTAALLADMDLVISVDTSVAHLAGALAKPVWVLLPFVPDWRWMLDRQDSPWYPTMRLFRQDETRTWHSVIARVSRALNDFVRRVSSGESRYTAAGSP